MLSDPILTFSQPAAAGIPVADKAPKSVARLGELQNLLFMEVFWLKKWDVNRKGGAGKRGGKGESPEELFRKGRKKEKKNIKWNKMDIHGENPGYERAF